MKEILNEIIDKIRMIDDYKEFKGYDDYFRAGVSACIEEVERIFEEYLD